MLHFENKQIIQKSNTAQVQVLDDIIEIKANLAIYHQHTVLLATALIGVYAKNGTVITLRALFDQGSQSAFLSENAAQTLALTRNRINAIITGNKSHAAKHFINVTAIPRFESNFVINASAIILPKLTSVSHVNCDENDFEFIDNMILADPSFKNNSEIDMILGASEYAQAIKMGLIKSEKNIIAQNTEFGWIVSGAIQRKASTTAPIVTLVTNVELDTELNKFSNTEDFEVEDKLELTEEEKFCETHFQETCYQNEIGQFVVTMPFKNGISEPELGDSRRVAVATQLQMEFLPICKKS